MMDGNLRVMGQALRQLQLWAEAAAEKERAIVARQRGIMRRIVDSNVRFMGMGYNKLVEEWKARQNNLKEKLRFVIKALNEKDTMFVLQAFNGLKQRALMLDGVGMGNAGMKKIQLVRRLMNQGYNLQVQGVNALLDFLKSERVKDERAREEFERTQKLKDRCCRRIADVNLRLLGQGFRQLQQFVLDLIEKERALAAKQRGICKRLANSAHRLMGMAMNNLVAYSKKDAGIKKRTILKIIDKNLGLMSAALRLMKINCWQLRELEDKRNKLRKQVVNKLIDANYRFAHGFLKKLLEENRAAKHADEIKKNRMEGIFNRMLNGNLRKMGGCLQYMRHMNSTEKNQAEKEERLKRKLIVRLMDQNMNLMAQALNVMKQNHTAACQVRDHSERLKKRFIYGLMNANIRLMQMAMNNLKQNCNICRLQEEQFNERKGAMTKNLCNMMYNSAIGQIIIGMRKLRDHNDNVNGLLEKQRKLCKMINGVINNNDRLAKMHYLHTMVQHKILMVKREKVLKMINQSATGTMYFVFTKFREHFSLMAQLDKMNKAQKERLLYKMKDCMESTLVGMQSKG